jgi:anti-sigma regulatory factor (Ser/Thr protein kinase)
MILRLTPSSDSAHLARQAVTRTLMDLGRADLVDDAAIVVSELVANGVMHARTEISLSVEPAGDGIRVSVTDGSHILPRWTPTSSLATSGRGLLLVEQLSTTWGVEPLSDGGKVVWAEIDHRTNAVEDITAESLLELWSEEPWPPAQPPPGQFIAVTLEIDIAAMLDSRAHTEDLVRELQLAQLNATWGITSEQSQPAVVRLARQLDSATEAFHEARQQMLHQTLAAAKRGHTRATLHLQLQPSDVAAAQEWLAAIDEASSLTDAGVLLLPPFPAAMNAFRHAYIADIIEQLEASAPADPTPTSTT